MPESKEADCATLRWWWEGLPVGVDGSSISREASSSSVLSKATVLWMGMNSFPSCGSGEGEPNSIASSKRCWEPGYSLSCLRGSESWK